MNSPKSTALTLLMVGSVFWFVVTCMQMVTFIIQVLDYGYFGWSLYWILNIAGIALQFVASLLIMIGFIKYRSERSKSPLRPSMMMPTQLTSPPMQVAPTRLCSNCGRQIPTEAKFCPFCGWQG